MKKEILRFVLKIFPKRKMMVGIPAIIKNSKGEILLGKRSNKMIYYPNLWGLPGGIAEYGETIESAIKREIKEEIGVDSTIIKYGKVFMQMPVKECPFQSLNIPVYCKIKGTPKARDETSKVKWVKPKEIRKMKLAYSHKKILENEGIII